MAAPWRRQNIASKIVGAILGQARVKSTGFFALVQPTCTFVDPALESELGRKKAIEEGLRIAEEFWQSLGFRRVGASEWFAFTDDSNHASRQLAASEDLEAPSSLKPHGLITAEMTAVMETLVSPDTTGAQCVQQIRDAFPDAEAAKSWTSLTDEQGNTILHIAVKAGKAEVISHVLTICPPLASVSNCLGYTPLEVAQGVLEPFRTRLQGGGMTWVMSDKFEGFNQRDVACVAALMGTEVSDLSELSSAEDIGVWVTAHEKDTSPGAEAIRATLRIKYGCTCGRCLGGFLSPRMALALEYAADFQHDSLGSDYDDGEDWYMFHGDSTRHLPQSVRQNLKTNKSLRRGFANMHEHVARCLKEGRIPTKANILDFYRNRVNEWPPVTRNYLDRGGTVEGAANGVFGAARIWDELAGDGLHMDAAGAQINELPACRNDHEFGFVSGMCGYDRMAPY